MIYHSLDDEAPYKELIGFQRDNLSYTYQHWKHGYATSKYKFVTYSTRLSRHEYSAVGPTMLVEWLDDKED